MVRRKDRIWEHAEQVKGKKKSDGFVCKFCRCEFSGGATRIKCHLSKVGGGDIKACTQVPDHVRLAAAQSTPSPKRHKIRTRTSYGDHYKDGRCLVDANLAKFLFLNDIPLGVVETPSFMEFVKSVGKFGGDYELPSLSMLQRHKCNNDTSLVERVEEYGRDTEESLVQTGCTLIANKLNVGAVIYVWTPKGILFKAKVEYDSDMSGLVKDELFLDKLSCIVKSLGPKHIVQYICDYQYEESKGVFSHYPWVCTNPCAALQLEFIILDIGFSDNEGLQCTAMIFLYIINNNYINVPLGKEHERSVVSCSKILLSYKMNIDSESFASLVIVFSWLKSLLAAEDAVRALQVCTPSTSSHLSEQSVEAKYARFVDLAIHCEEFWRRGKELVQVLQPVFVAFGLACDGATIGYLYQAMQRVKSKCKEFDISVIHPVHKVAALLDPSYMLDQNFDKSAQWIHKRRSFILDDLVQDIDKEGFRIDFRAYCSQDSNLFTSSALAMLSTLHPGEWWERFGHCVPVLQKYALKIVTQPCSSRFFTREELTAIIGDETDGQLKTKMIMMDRFSITKSHLQGPTQLDDQLTGLYGFTRQEGSDIQGYNSMLDQLSEIHKDFWNDSNSMLDKISEIHKDFWNDSHDPNFQLFDKWPL